MTDKPSPEAKAIVAHLKAIAERKSADIAGTAHDREAHRRSARIHADEAAMLESKILLAQLAKQSRWESWRGWLKPRQFPLLHGFLCALGVDLDVD